MRAERCREWRPLLGAHALGQLSPDEQAGLEAHIEGCPDCREELDALASVARLLPLADPERFETAPALPPALAGRVVGRIAAERRTAQRRRWGFRIGLGGAVAAATATLAIVLLPGGGGPQPSQRIEFAGLPPGMEITATLKPHAFGTEIEMYVKGVRSGTLCRVFLRASTGTRLPAGSFRYRWGEEADAVLTSALDLSRTRTIGVRVGNRTFVAPVSTDQTASSTQRDQTAASGRKIEEAST